MRKKIIYTCLRLIFILITLVVTAGISFAAEYWLKAEAFDKTMPDSTVVKMWGFASCDSTFTTCSAPTTPGPTLVVPSGDSNLTINLINNLTGPFVEPVSLIIPGQNASLSPVKFTDATGRQRVKSFTTETPADNTTVITYIWTNFKPGTYLYQSGRHPAVQVQMGLYGAIKKDAASGEAYAGVPYASEVALLYSEIDTALHTAVADGSYGTAMTSTIDYEPDYFLINGEPYSSATSPVSAGSAGSNILVRFLNAGLETHVPIINGLYMNVVAEDGNKYLYPKNLYSLMLPAGKTADVILTPNIYGRYPVYDRSLFLTNAASSPGGMLAYLDVGSGTALPAAIGVFSTDTWYLDVNGSGSWDGTPPDITYWFGLAGSQPVTGDWDSDGTTEVGAYDNGTWYLDSNKNGVWDGAPTDQVFSFDGGIAAAVPVTGDWNRDGLTEVGVYKDGTWYIDYNGNGTWDGAPADRAYWFGLAGAIPVTGDWDGDGATEIGIYDNGTWYLDVNGNGTWDGSPTDSAYWFGLGGAIPVTGDWDGNGKTEIGVYLESTWYIDLNGNGTWDGSPTDSVYWFGLAGAAPVTGKWQ